MSPANLYLAYLSPPHLCWKNYRVRTFAWGGMVAELIVLLVVIIFNYSLMAGIDSQTLEFYEAGAKWAEQDAAFDFALLGYSSMGEAVAPRLCVSGSAAFKQHFFNNVITSRSAAGALPVSYAQVAPYWHRCDPGSNGTDHASSVAFYEQKANWGTVPAIVRHDAAANRVTISVNGTMGGCWGTFG